MLLKTKQIYLTLYDLHLLQSSFENITGNFTT